MQLLIQRGQGRILILPIFDLWAKFELDLEEQALITKYHVRKHILVEGKPLQRWRAAIFGIIIAGVIAAIIHNFLGILPITLLIFVGSAYLLYHQFREEIRVSDILAGRHFTCRSVVKLMATEQEVAEMAHAFRHLLEAMKTWGGRGIIELEPYKEPVLRLVEPPQIDADGGAVTKGLTPVWLSGVAIITGMVSIGGYFYFARPVGEASKVAQEPMLTESSPSSAESSVSQDIHAVQQPDTRKENLQEDDITQVLSLAEGKLLEVKRRAEGSLPPKRGNRKRARAANDRGLADLQSGRISEAISAFQEAHRANPVDVEIVNNLGYTYLLSNDLDSGERYMLTALTMQPGRSAGWDNLGQIYARRGQMPADVASFTNAYRFSRDVRKTHSYFLGLMEKENDVNLKQALRQATQVGGKWFLSAEQNSGLQSKN